MKHLFAIFVLLLALPLWGQSFNGQITFQELLPYTGSGYPSGLNRTAYPASMSFPLAAGDAPAAWWTGSLPSGSSQLGLSTATMGQFRCLAWHADGSCKNVLVDTEVTNNFSSTALYTGVSLTLTGAGNFGGSALAVDNAKILSDGSACEAAGTSSGYICVSTGTLRAQIKKSGFNGFDKVVAGAGNTVLVNGGSDGLVIRGPDTTQAMPSSPSAPSASAVAGGTYSSSNTFYVKAACVGASGESLPSVATAGISVGSGQLLQVSNPCSGGYYNVYAGTSTGQGSMSLQNIQPVNTATWTEPTACPFSGYGCFSGRGITNYNRGALVYAGNSTGCGTACATDYKTSLDTGSTAVVEENGPVKAVIRIKAAASNGTVSFLKEDSKLVFFKNSSLVRQPVLLKNADDPCPSAVSSADACYNTTHLASDFKGFSAHEMRVKPAFTVSGAAFATDSTPVSVTPDGSHDAYLYQGYSVLHRKNESDNTAICMNLDAGCYFPDILRFPVSGDYSYAQKGYIIQANNANQATNASGGSYGLGWADFTGSSGQGIQVGFWSMATEWPKALAIKWVTDHYEIRAGILPDQTLFDAATAQPYYLSWPQYRIADIIYNFHDSPLADANSDFLKAQYYLVGRASVDAYNRAQMFGKAFPLLDPVAVDNYQKGIGTYCPGVAGKCVPDYVAQAIRAYSWPQAAEGNQNDWDWEFLAQFLERGLTGRLLYAIYDSRYFMTQELARADGFNWRSRPVGTLSNFGFPADPNASNGKYQVGNAPLGQRNWNGAIDGGAHGHFYGGPMFMFGFTGDSFLKDALDQAWGDYVLNAGIAPIVNGAQSGYGFSQDRGVGIQIMHRAQYYAYANSQKNSADAAQALSVASTILNNQMPLTLKMRGFGTNIKGVNPSTGYPKFAELDNTGSTTDGPGTAANISSITCNAGGTHATVVMASGIGSGGVGDSAFVAPEVVRVAGVPSGNFNGDVKLDTITDMAHFGYPAACTANATCSGAGSCGTVNVPGKCPADTNGSCANQLYTDTFMGPLMTQGLVNLIESTQSATSDPNAVWASHTQAEDTALGILRQQLYEILLPQTGQIGGVYYTYGDYYNSDKHFALHPNCRQNMTYGTWGMWWSLIGTVTPEEQAAFEDLISCKWASDFSWEYGSPVVEAGIAHLTGFPNAAWPTLVTASHSDSCVASDGDLGSPHCHLSVTVPAGATRYRVKARNDGKTIVDSLNFDNKTDPASDGSGCVAVSKYWSLSYGGTAASDWSGCYGLRPDQNWPFFSSTEVSSLPAPAGATQDIVVSAANYAALNTSTLSQNKFAVKALVNGGESTPSYTFTLTLSGAGSGSVTDGVTFNCSSGTCTHEYTEGATPTLTATPSGGGSFAGWSSGSGVASGCSGTGSCGPLSITGVGSVIATFNAPVQESSGSTLRGGTLKGGVIR